MVILWAVIDATYMVGGFCNEHHKGKLLQVTNLLGASYGKKNIEARTICNDIVERFKPSKSDKEAAKLSWDGVSNNEKLGFGKDFLPLPRRNTSL